MSVPRASSATTSSLCLLAIVLLLPLASAAIYETCPGKTMLKSGGLTCHDRQVILDSHNKMRQSVALGRVSGQPAATDMQEMVWDDELAAVAQNWADQCTLAHDGSRNVARFKVGQNIASTWTTRTNLEPAADFPRQVLAWFDEVRDYGFYSTGFSHKTGHYSQLVWADTYLIGCGYSYYYDPAKGYTKMYVCNYGPGGNIIGLKPYTVGNPSCAVPSKRYQGLCAASGLPPLGASCAGGSGALTSSSTAGPWTAPAPSTTPHPFWQNFFAGGAQNASRYSWYFYG
ncbi:venom allergen 5-like [Bacillus rossius redtenbacheri]|uniref:venom allergen 5-like n=1 Tax=Bacillus rossius redtenbacheri TaxID=93214 RepID=UPI002FDD3973